jgi:hypothetical protein
MSCGAGDKHIVSGFPARIKNAGGMPELAANGREIAAGSGLLLLLAPKAAHN